MTDTVPASHRIDRRAGELIEKIRRSRIRATAIMTEAEAAALLEIPRSFLRLGRVRGFGPRHMPRGRYAAGNLIEWLHARGRVHQIAVGEKKKVGPPPTAV
jgi:hypothetical protein